MSIKLILKYGVRNPSKDTQDGPDISVADFLLLADKLTRFYCNKFRRWDSSNL